MKRTPKFGSRYGVRKFRLGGGTDDTGSKAGYEESPPDFEAPKKKSFSEAFREARKAGDATFMWQGKKYTTEVKKKEKKEEKTPARKASPEEFSANMNARLGSEEKILPDNFVPTSRLRGMYPELEERSKAAKTDKDIAREMYSGISRYRNTDSVYENLAKGRKPGYRATPGFKKGGSVSSASRRADGIAKKGKTRGKMC